MGFPPLASYSLKKPVAIEYLCSWSALVFFLAPYLLIVSPSPLMDKPSLLAMFHLLLSLSWTLPDASGCTLPYYL